MSIAFAIFEGLSSIITISAASIAASEPRPPIAIPTSDLVKTGASLIPSPANITLLFFSLSAINSSSFSTFCAGSNSA